MTAADRDERVYGLDQRGLATIRSTGCVGPNRIFEVTTESQDVDGSGALQIRLRVEVAVSSTKRFSTSTTAAITITDVPRYQPRQHRAVRYMPEYPGVVVEERSPDAAARPALETTICLENRHLPEHTGMMPQLTPTPARPPPRCWCCCWEPPPATEQ